MTKKLPNAKYRGEIAGAMSEVRYEEKLPE